jgi:glyoxylase-like metal-dependent hydrolase (beta-lactamase superfamily II)
VVPDASVPVVLKENLMDPTLGEPFPAGPDTHVIPTYWPVPNAGVIPMNAFVVHAAEPVLVDTGTGALTEPFLEALASIVDPARLRWIWLTHEDLDHTGSLRRLLELAPRATVLTTFMAIGRMAPAGPFPMDRVRLVNPGDTVNVGDRNLRALRPPLFDSPATVGLLDDRTGALFSSDCFGAPLPEYAMAAARSADEIPADVLAAAQVAWATIDSSWVTTADPAKLGHALDEVRRRQPERVLSSHLPPIERGIDRALDALRTAPLADPVPGLTQTELEALLAGFEPGADTARTEITKETADV